MKIIELTEDIVNFEADVLVYSTNQNLNLSGGVGACLVEKYGYSVQYLLDKFIENTPDNEVAVGSVFEGHTENMPWKKVFHTVATDLEYCTDTKIVSNIIREVLDICELDYSINSIVFSALGAGFGSLTYDEFILLINAILSEYSDQTLTVYIAHK